MRRVLTVLALLALTASAAPLAAASQRDGTHDFDFLNGDWTITLHRLRNPLSHSNDWYSMTASSRSTPMWGGQGQVQDAAYRAASGKIYGLTVRMYNPNTHQWSLYWGTTANGVDPNPQVGHFDGDGTGSFYAYTMYKGRKVYVRYKWWQDAVHPHFEQSYSIDGGKTWEANWKTDYVRATSMPADDVASPFAFLNGTWKLQYSRLAHPLANASDWYSFAGTSSARNIWGGRGQVEDGPLYDPHGTIYGVTVRIQNPATKKWSLYWGTRDGGMIADPPQVGMFCADGMGYFDAPDVWHGKNVLVRFKWNKNGEHPHFAQLFSTDHGKTWERNWVSDYTRLGG